MAQISTNYRGGECEHYEKLRILLVDARVFSCELFAWTVENRKTKEKQCVLQCEQHSSHEKLFRLKVKVCVHSEKVWRDHMSLHLA